MTKKRYKNGCEDKNENKRKNSAGENGNFLRSHHNDKQNTFGTVWSAFIIHMNALYDEGAASTFMFLFDVRDLWEHFCQCC